MLEVIKMGKKIMEVNESIIDVQASPFVGLRIKFETIDTEIECNNEIGSKIRNDLIALDNVPTTTLITINMDDGRITLKPMK